MSRRSLLDWQATSLFENAPASVDKPPGFPGFGPSIGLPLSPEHAVAHLNARGYVQFHPVLASRLDSFKAAIFLGHALYWSRHLASRQAQTGGWFYLTARQWEEATALSPREQAAVRELLLKHGLLDEALAGRPAKLHFKVNLAGVAKLLGMTRVEQLSWASLATLFQSSIRFYKPLADVTGSASAGLYMSQLLCLQRAALVQGAVDARSQQPSPFARAGEIQVNPEQIRIALGLGVKTQRNARDRLKASGLITEGRSSGGLVSVQINLAAISACLQAQAGKVLPGSRHHVGALQARANKPAPAAPDLKLVDGKPVPAPGTTPAAAAKPSGMLAQVAGKPLLGPGVPSPATTAPTRQLALFGAGLVSRGARQALAGIDDVPTPAPSAAQQVASLFSPGAAMLAASLGPTTPALSATGTVPAGQGSAAQAAEASKDTAGEFALLSKLENGNLPFCRNDLALLSKQKGIKNINTTTTAREATEPALEASRRRRVEDETAGKEENGAPQGYPLPHGQSAPTEASKASAAPVHVAAEGAQSALILPPKLAPEWREAVAAAVERVKPQHRQEVLDELAGQMALPNKTIHNPAGWLHGLITRFNAGTAALAMAASVSADRERRERLQEAMDEVASRPVTMAPAASAPKVTKEVDPAIKQRLADMRQRLAAKAAGRAVEGDDRA